MINVGEILWIIQSKQSFFMFFIIIDRLFGVSKKNIPVSEALKLMFKVCDYKNHLNYQTKI